MTNRIKDTNIRDTVEADAAHTSNNALSKEAFANPLDFLQVLKCHYADIAHDRDGMSMPDLVYYSEHGADPQVRAAAGIAAKHFDELLAMPEAGHAAESSPHDHISSNDLDMDMTFYQGHTSWTTEKVQAEDLALAAAYGTSSIALGTAAVSLTEMPILAAVCGAFSFASWVRAGAYAYDAWIDSDLIKARASKDQRILNSWSEINAPSVKRNS